MADGGERFLGWTTLPIEVFVSCCGNLLCGHGFDLFAHVFSHSWWKALEDVFSKQMVDFDVFYIFLELEEKL